MRKVKKWICDESKTGYIKIAVKSMSSWVEVARQDWIRLWGFLMAVGGGVGGLPEP